MSTCNSVLSNNILEDVSFFYIIYVLSYDLLHSSTDVASCGKLNILEFFDDNRFFQ